MEVSALLAAELSAPFERATEADAATLVRRHWGLTPARANRVDTERDDTFHVETDTPLASYALKVAHPGDDQVVVDLRTAAIEWAAERDPSLPLARPIPTVDGTLQPVVAQRVARLFPWMPGQSLRAALWDAAPEAPLLHAIGATHARLTVALAEFRHPAESRAIAWDVARLPELAGLLDSVAEPGPVEAALDRHLAEVAPRLADLPQQVIHNDGNLDNLLVDDRAT
jgi:hydroxylysine kinase